MICDKERNRISSSESVGFPGAQRYRERGAPAGLSRFLGILALGCLGRIPSRTSSPSEENSSELSGSVSESVTYRDSECNKDVGGNA